MEAKTFIPLVGRATSCQCATEHRPVPLRFVWHHILPEVCGGRDTRDNLVSVCDSCHYAIHVLLYELKMRGTLQTYLRFRSTVRGTLAIQGWLMARAAGTVDKIPNQGGAL